MRSRSKQDAAWWQVASAALASAGVAVSAYLVAIHYDRDVLVCGAGDCHTVQDSAYAEIGGVPISLLGLTMNSALLGLAFLRWRRPGWNATITAFAFATVLAGTVYSAYLTYLEVAVIDAICQWCVASALLTAGILAAEGIGVRQTL
jgi:uncharacterized membrane protein